METSDKKLISQCKKGNRESCNLLLKRYEKFIYTICYHYTVSREDSLDLLQEVYIKLFKTMDRFDESQLILPWIKRITVNTCLNFIRSRKEQTLSLYSFVDGEENSIEDFIASTVNVENEVSFTDTKRIIESMIRELPEDMRMAVILRHIQGMSYDDIANSMSCPVGTVKTYLFRGRKLLKDRLKEAGIWEV